MHLATMDGTHTPPGRTRPQQKTQRMFDNPVLESSSHTASGASGPLAPGWSSESRIGGSIRPEMHGRVRVVLGRGFARDTVVVRIGGIEVGRRCGVTTLPGGVGGTILGEVPVGTDTAQLDVEVVGRRLRADIELATPGSGETTVEANLTDSKLQLAVR
ncbi:MAG: hypothetical protein R2754_00715 [Microthrixaceae bacterium]